MIGLRFGYGLGRACFTAALCAISLTALPLSAQPPGPGEEQIVDVRIVGNRVVSVSKLPRLATRAGQTFDPLIVEEDVRTLSKTRKFLEVKPKYQKVAGGIVVIFEVLERPSLAYVRYVGNDQVKESKLKKQAELEVGSPLDPYAVDEARRKIEQYYHERGYNQAQVTVLEGNKQGDRGAVFQISEGPSERVFWTAFKGNSVASDARLKTQIQSKPGILWMFKGYVDRKKIDEDVDRLTAYYRSLGYFRARVGRELEFGESGKWVTLTFVIDEGPRYIVRNVSFVGNKKFSTERISADLKLKNGQHFDQMAMTKDLGALRDVYGSEGYIFADIKADPRFLEEPGQLDLVYQIDEGARYRVGRIYVNISGDNPHTQEAVVRNRLTLRTGDIVDIRKLRDSERRVKASGLFLNDPTRGIAPKIVFTPAEGSDEQVVGRPKQGDNFRGQSPDERVLNVDIYGELDRATNKMLYRSGEGHESRVPCPPRPGSDFWHEHPVEQAAPGNLQQPIVRGQSPDNYGYGGSAVQPVGPDAGFSRSSAQPPTDMFVANYPDPNYPVPPNYSAYPPAGATPPANQAYGPAQPYPYSPSPYQGAASPPAGYANGAPGAYGPGGDPQNIGPIGISGPDQNQNPGGDVYYEYAPPNADPYVDIVAQAQEAQTGRFMFGVGVNSDAGLVGSIVLEERNFDAMRLPGSWEDFRTGRAFRGAGQGFRLEAAPGTQVQRYVVSFTEPYVFDTPVSFNISASYYERRQRDWDEERASLRTGLGYQLRPNLSIGGSFRIENIDISNPRQPTPPELAEVVGNNDLYGFKVQLSHDTRDSSFLPTEGHLIEIGVEQVLGTFDYTRETVEARQYFLMRQRPDGSGRHVLSVGGQVGFTGEDTPLYDHFFAGGFSTMRGFDYRGASPRSSFNPDVIVGGEFQLLGSVEYLFPITADDMLRAVVFCDFGTVEENIEINNDNLRIAPGVGLRITVPALGPAPIALDFAFPVADAAGDDKQVFSFFVGALR